MNGLRRMTRVTGLAHGPRTGLLLALLLLLPGMALGDVDLTVTGVDVSAVGTDPQTLSIGGSASATVKNLGGDDATGFMVLFFEDRDGNGAFDVGVDVGLGNVMETGLPAGGEMVSTAPVGGTVLFAGNLIHAMVDAWEVVAESDEDNNLSNSGLDCTVDPPTGVFTPVLEWSWTSSAVEPSALNVMMTPSVIDLNGDTIPDVVFASTASTGGGLVEVGFLRALNGNDGSELFTVTDPARRVNTASSVAVGDIDLDGSPEILACDTSGARLMAFEHDGTFKWLSPTLETIYWGAPSIADLNGDGTPEIVIGRQVLDNTGAILGTGTGGRGTQGNSGPLSLVADLDLDGSPDVMAGNTAYTSTGSVMWSLAATVPDGVNAVANFDADPNPEVVLVANGQVRLLEHDGSVKWGPVAIPGGGAGGPPTIADYDGDGEAEIGVAGASRYAVFETDGSLLWMQVTQDNSSNRTGSSVFDFDGDGAAEVVYRDELYLRVYRGTDGFVLFQTPLSSCTWFEYVLVADVDADGNAEIVAVANNNCGLGPQRGVFVFGDAADNWVPTRRIWNQHTYHITNINDDGTIPAVEDNNWLSPAGDPFNNYRQNVLTGNPPGNLAPDLTASLFQCTGIGDGYVTARIGNGGSVVVGAGVPMSFYDGDPSAGGTLLGTMITTTGLEPGEFEDVTLALPPGVPLTTNFFVVADDAGYLVSTENECDEDNNVHAVDGCVPSDPVSVVKTADPPAVPASGANVTFTVVVTNESPVPLQLLTVDDDHFGDLNPACAPALPAVLEPGESVTCVITEFLAGSPGVPHVNVVTATLEDRFAYPVTDSDDAMVQFILVCDPDPHSQGYWHRQCLGVPAADGGIDPGRNGRGPQSPTEPDFVKTLIPAVDQRLQDSIFVWSTCEGMDADPPSDPCEKAIKQYTALLLNIESGRVQESCNINTDVLECGSTTMPDLLDELAALINSGDPNACKQAKSCAGALNEGDGYLSNLPPVAVDDFFTTLEDVPVSGNVLNDNGGGGADFDPDFDLLSIETAPVTGPFSGTVVLNSDGSFTYTPDPDFHGVDMFEYRVDDGRGGTDVGLVTIQVTPVNDPPAAADDAFDTDEDVPVSGNVLDDNGFGPDLDVDGDPLTVAPVPLSGPSSGMVSLSTDGSFTYTPGPDFNGIDMFDYAVQDPDGDADTATVAITVLPVNDPPTAVDDAFVTDEEVPVSGNVLDDNGFGADSDVDGDPVFVDPTTPVSGPSDGTLVLNADGSFTYTPDDGFADTDMFEYSLTDGLLSDTATVTIVVSPVDDPPTAVDDFATVTENDPATLIDVLLNDTDPDGGSKTIDSVSDPAGGTVVIVGGGTGVTYEPDPFFCNDGTPTDDFTYTLVEGGSSATVHVTVTCVDQPVPTVDPIAYATVGNTQLRAGGAVGASAASVTDPLGILVKAAPVDPDGGPSPITVVPFTGLTTNGGNLQLNADGSFLYEPAPGFTGVDPHIYTLTDGANPGFGTLQITVTEQVWYVDNTAASGGDGRSTAPFDTLKDAESPVSGDGDTIFVFEGNGGTTNQSAGFVLANGQSLLGEGVGLAVPGFGTLVPAGSRPRVSNASGAGLTALNVADVEIRGLDILIGTVGVSLTNSETVTLASMRIESLSDFGIDGSTVTNLTLDTVDISNSGNAVGEAAMRLNGIRGAGNLFTNSTFTASTSAERAVQITSTVGDATTDVLTISGSTFEDTFASPVGADLLEINLSGVGATAANLQVDITGCTFAESRTNGVQVLASGDSQGEVNIGTSNFTDMGIGIDLATNNSADLTFDVSNNPTIHARPGFGATMVNVFTAATSSATGRVNNNPSIDVGGGSGTGIRFRQNDSSALIVEALNNTVFGVVNDLGIDAFARDGNGRLDATISNNTITVDSLALYDIRVQAGNGGGDANTVCANVTGNVTSGAAIAAFRERTADAGATVLLQGFNTNATTTWGSNGNSPAGSVSESNNGTLTGGTCNTVP